MAENAWVPKRRKRFKVTTKSNSSATSSPNVLEQDFTASRPNEKWVGDITYIWTQAGWLYLATVMDLFSPKIIGFSLSNRINKELVIQALHNAVLRNGKPDREEAKNGIFDYSEIFYNKQRAHSFLGFISPEQFENNYRCSYDGLH